MTPPKIRLRGSLTCPADRLLALRAALPEHIQLTRQEPGCLSFEVQEHAEGHFLVEELFRDREAFEAHQSRTRASEWFRVSEGIARDYKVSEE